MENDLKIIGGDLNLILDPVLDRKGDRTHPQINAAEVVRNYSREAELVDVWRTFNPDHFAFTWMKKNPTVLMERLDYILVSEALQPLIEEVGINPAFCSDHSMPWIVLAQNTCIRGSGFWKLNTSLLLEEPYEELIKTKIRLVIRKTKMPLQQ